MAVIGGVIQCISGRNAWFGILKQCFDMNKHLFIGILMISKKMKQCFMSENCFI